MPTTANEFIEQQLSERLRALEGAFDSDALCVTGTLLYGVDDLVRAVVEDMRQENTAQERLCVVLTTDGGYIEPVQRIVETIRHHYDHVSFVIPNYAFSAGTILAMSGDEIYMDYYSRLGPIDPQVQTPKGRPVPAVGYLKQWESLLEKAREGKLTTVEAQLMIESFDQAELYEFEHAVELSVTLLIEWLVGYKFKHWTETETTRTQVTDEMRKERAEAIARELNNTDRWHSHGYGISMAVLQNDLGLRINDLDREVDLRDKLRLYYGLLSDYMQKLGNAGALHRVGRYFPYM